MKLSVNERIRYQIFDGFGASGAWWAQVVGGWDEVDESGMSKRDRISQLLYNKENGIGLRTYRYNIGGGSAESGRGIYWDDARRAECFGSVGNYDFSRDANAVYMMRKAAEDGADEIILFVNSPVESLTKNGMAQLGKRQIFRTNLAKKNYDKFAQYCLDVTEHFVKEGLPIKYLSPVNEPLWIWNGGQEGCHYSPRQAGLVMKCVAEKLKTRPALKGVRLSGVENGDIRWFNKSYTREMLRHKSVRELVDSVDIHSYFINNVEVPFFNNRIGFLKRYRNWMDRRYPDVPVKMSEWTHMKGGRDAGMDSALETAKVIMEDISVLNVTSWQHWLACSPYDYCDGLIYLDFDNRTYSITKRYYVTGNFSKFIPFGAQRFEISTDCENIKTVGFINNGDCTVVFANFADKTEDFTADKDGVIYITDENRSLEKTEIRAGDKIILPARSVTTYIYRS
ncbi:MAG: xylanase [Clostridia bacterium]|nr:xylanase [Clostridia bacterium]